MTWKPGNETWLVYIILLKENFFQIFYKKSGVETSSRLLYFFKRIKHNVYWQMIFLKQTGFVYLEYVIAKPSHMSE